MSLLTQISNKIQYTISEAVSDPAAEAYAKQQEAQKKFNEDVKKREEQKKKEEEERAKKAAEDKLKAQDIKRRSEFNFSKLISDASSGILTAVIVIVILGLFLYGGHLAANQAIGYSVFGRLVAFFYGCLMSWYLVPKALYEIVWLDKRQPYYGFLPLYQYTPNGYFEQVLYGAVCYTPDDESRRARENLGYLYERGSKFLRITQNT